MFNVGRGYATIFFASYNKMSEETLEKLWTADIKMEILRHSSCQNIIKICNASTHECDEEMYKELFWKHFQNKYGVDSFKDAFYAFCKNNVNTTRRDFHILRMHDQFSQLYFAKKNKRLEYKLYTLDRSQYFISKRNESIPDNNYANLDFITFEITDDIHDGQRDFKFILEFNETDDGVHGDVSFSTEDEENLPFNNRLISASENIEVEEALQRIFEGITYFYDMLFTRQNVDNFIIINPQLPFFIDTDNFSF